jgi:hypothetical protein
LPGYRLSMGFMRPKMPVDWAFKALSRLRNLV